MMNFVTHMAKYGLQDIQALLSKHDINEADWIAIKDFVEYSEPNELTSFLTNVSFKSLFDQISTSAKIDPIILGDILRALFRRQNTFLLNSIIICTILKQKNVWLKKLFLQELYKLSCVTQNINEIFLKTEINQEFLLLLKEKETEITNYVIKIYEKLFDSQIKDQIVHVLLTSHLEILTNLIRDKNSIIKIRTIELIILMSKTSVVTFNLCNEKGLIQPLLNELPGTSTNGDFLTQSAVTELFEGYFKPKTDLAHVFAKIFEPTLTKLCQYIFTNNFLPSPNTQQHSTATNNSNNNQLEKYFLLPGLLKFLGTNIDYIPKDSVEILIKSVCQELINNQDNILTEDNEQCIIVGACLDYIININKSNLAKALLVSEDSFPTALQTVVKIYMGIIGSGNLKVRSIDTIASLFKDCSIKPNEELTIANKVQNIFQLILSYAKQFGAYTMPSHTPSPIPAPQNSSQNLVSNVDGIESSTPFWLRIFTYLGAPNEDERESALEFMNALAAAYPPWGGQALITQSPPIILEYLLYRGGTAETPHGRALAAIHFTKRDRESKWQVLKTLISADSAFYKHYPGPIALKIKTYVKEGPLYIETVAQSQTETMGM